MNPSCCVDYKKIKKIRMEKKISRPKLAKACNIDKITIWRIESFSEHGVNVCTLNKIAEALGVQIKDFLLDETIKD